MTQGLEQLDRKFPQHEFGAWLKALSVPGETPTEVDLFGDSWGHGLGGSL